jgi:hypothetical protein
MRFGSSLTEKALLALEEAVQLCRYQSPRRCFAYRFALAYLWSLRPGDRKPYDEMWKALGASKTPWSFSAADTALLAIYDALGLPRDPRVAHRLWSRIEAERRRTDV